MIRYSAVVVLLAVWPSTFLFSQQQQPQTSDTTNTTTKSAPPAQPGQTPRSTDPGATATTQPEPQSKRLFGIIPNFRTSGSLAVYKPLTTKEKFKIATQDSFDRGTFILAGLFAAESLAVNSEPSFGHGIAGYGRYYATSYADLFVGDYMTEAVLPSLLHQDPRYFRQGSGSTFLRLRHATGQIFWTLKDSGGHEFNYSEIGGNAAAVAISNAYYPGGRDVSDAISKFGLQIGVDMASNLIKEFAPDIIKHLPKKRSVAPAPAP